MSVMKRLEKVLETMPQDKQREVLHFAEFLCCRDEHSASRSSNPPHLFGGYQPKCNPKLLDSSGRLDLSKLKPPSGYLPYNPRNHPLPASLKSPKETSHHDRIRKSTAWTEW